MHGTCPRSQAEGATYCYMTINSHSSSRRYLDLEDLKQFFPHEQAEEALEAFDDDKDGQV